MNLRNMLELFAGSHRPSKLPEVLFWQRKIEDGLQIRQSTFWPFWSCSEGKDPCTFGKKSFPCWVVNGPILAPILNFVIRSCGQRLDIMSRPRTRDQIGHLSPWVRSDRGTRHPMVNWRNPFRQKKLWMELLNRNRPEWREQKTAPCSSWWFEKHSDLNTVT